MLKTFWELLRESVIVQAIVTLGLTTAYVVLACSGQPIPDGLHSLTILALGFYFGAKSTTTQATAYRDAINTMTKNIAGKREDC